MATCMYYMYYAYLICYYHTTFSCYSLKCGKTTLICVSEPLSNYFVSIVISELYFLQTRSFGGPRRISYTTLSVIYTVGIGGVDCCSWQVLLKIWVLTFVIHVCHIILLMFIEQWNCRRSCRTLRWAMIAFILPNWQSRSLQSIWKPT